MLQNATTKCSKYLSKTMAARQTLASRQTLAWRQRPFHRGAFAPLADDHLSRPYKREKRNNPLFDRIGRSETVNITVDILYHKILNDDVLEPLFSKTDMLKLKDMQRSFLTMAYGGTSSYDGQDLRQVHSRLKITESQWDCFVGHLRSTMEDLEFPEREKAECMEIVDKLKSDIITSY